MTAPPLLSVIICSRDRPVLLRTALAGLAGRAEGVEVVVVDSASKGTLTREVASAAGARYVRADLPGVSRARNVGLAASRGELVAFTDDDCLPSLSWVDAVIDSFGPDVGVVTGPVMADRPTKLAVSVHQGSAERTLTAASDPFDNGHGANMAFRRSALPQPGPFDEVMGPGATFPAAEDVDVIYRVLAGGWRGTFNPKAGLVHKQWRSTMASLRTHFGYGVGAGAFLSKLGRGGSQKTSYPSVRSRVDNALRSAWMAARRGHEFGILANLLLAVGIVVGAVRARRLPVVEGLFVWGSANGR